MYVYIFFFVFVCFIIFSWHNDIHPRGHSRHVVCLCVGMGGEAGLDSHQPHYFVH